MTQAGDVLPPRRWSTWAAAVTEPQRVTVVVAIVGLAVRWWVRRGAYPLEWNDSFDYLASSHTPWLSTARWLGPRPALAPVVLSLAGSSVRTFVTVQTAVAAGAWALLAGAVATTLGPGWRRWLAAFGVLAISLTWPVTMWDQQVLTESLALSSLALVAAATVWASERLTRPRAAAVVAAALVALAVRDSHVVPVALGGLGMIAWALLRHPRRRRLALVTGAYLAGLALLVAGSAQWSHRDRVPLEHVYAVRILPYPQRVAWFGHHGMPDASQFATLPPVLTPGKAPYTSLNPLPAWAAWRRWLAADGKAALAEYAVTHPGYLVGETRHRPERVFNNGDGLATYRPLHLREVPGLARVAYPAPLLAFVAALPLLVLASWRRALRSPTVVAGSILIATSIPHALAAWHSDGMESARHLLIPAMQVRIGALLVLVGAALARPRGHPGEPQHPDRQPASSATRPATRVPA